MCIRDSPWAPRTLAQVHGNSAARHRASCFASMPDQGRMSRPMSRILYPFGRRSSIWATHCWAPQAATFGLGGQPHRVRQPPPFNGRGLLPCSRWGLPGRLCHHKRRCALTAPFHPYPCLRAVAVYSLLHFPADRSGLLLATTVPCGVRTFLDLRLPQVWGGSHRRDHPANSFAVAHSSARSAHAPNRCL